jgi:phospholysine phosphohistidine inorganic pyrophosphate phosphatase
MSDHHLRGILFDMDGVLYNADTLIPGATEAVTWVQAQRIPHLFLTNTTSKSRAALSEKLLTFGIPVHEAEILTPAVAAAAYLRAHYAEAISLFLRPSARIEFAGLPCLPDDAERGASHVVLGDLGDLWDYRTLNRAFRLLYHNPDAQLIALGMTRYWMSPDGIALDVAPFVAALEHACGRKALVLGKPATPFFHAAIEQLGLPATEILMIGDDIESDIAGAQAAGLKAALVQTGKFRPSDLQTNIQPDHILTSIAELPDWWS